MLAASNECLHRHAKNRNDLKWATSLAEDKFRFSAFAAGGIGRIGNGQCRADCRH